MTKTLDLTKPRTLVGGRLPLKYLQDGYGFNPAGESLGRYDAQGEPVDEQPVVTPKPVLDDDSMDSEGLGDLHEMTVLELRELAKGKDVITTGLNKAALIEALEG